MKWECSGPTWSGKKEPGALKVQLRFRGKALKGKASQVVKIPVGKHQKWQWTRHQVKKGCSHLQHLFPSIPTKAFNFLLGVVGVKVVHPLGPSSFRSANQSTDSPWPQWLAQCESMAWARPIRAKPIGHDWSDLAASAAKTKEGTEVIPWFPSGVTQEMVHWDRPLKIPQLPIK